MVAASVFVACAAEVGVLRGAGLFAAHALGGGGRAEVEVPEERVAFLDGVLGVGAEATLGIVVCRFLERHTHHGVDSVFAECLEVVGEVFPLVVYCRGVRRCKA